ncbi:MAG: SMI1/KNR4 family protein [Planctomycetes bacterium]|nr:SMI1/KNR4 family protein [Planctomycetota bacterium]
MAIDDLTQLVEPPKFLVEKGDPSIWRSIEQRIGTPLPDDFRDFGITYGSGSFVDPSLRISVYNPFSESFQERINQHRYTLEALKAGEGDEYFPYGIFPAPGGLVAWGHDDLAGELYWLTVGKPNNWRVIVRDDPNELEEFGETMTTFLAKVFARRISVRAWPEPILRDSVSIRFESEVFAVLERENPQTIYAFYVENGNRADFWVRDERSQVGVCYYVKAIGGKREGPLCGIPDEYDRPVVTMDIYANATLIEKDVDAPHGYQRSFFRVEPPTGA